MTNGCQFVPGTSLTMPSFPESATTGDALLFGAATEVTPFRPGSTELADVDPSVWR